MYRTLPDGVDEASCAEIDTIVRVEERMGARYPWIDLFNAWSPGKTMAQSTIARAAAQIASMESLPAVEVEAYLVDFCTKSEEDYDGLSPAWLLAEYKDPPKRPRGRPPLPPEEKKGTDGNPMLRGRFEPDVAAWVASKGGLHEVVMAAYRADREL